MGWPARTVFWLASPVQGVIQWTTSSVREIWQHYVAVSGAAQENLTLREELKIQKVKTVQTKELEIENQRLRELLEFREKEALHLLVAERDAAGSSPYERTIRLHRGANEGVAVGMAVVHPSGIVGQVVEVNPKSSQVLLLIDATSAIDVICQRSRARGILRGYSPNELHYEYLSKGEDLQVGDEIVSSGLDGVYPKGIPVGAVTAVDNSRPGLFTFAKVRPHVDFNRLEEAAIVLASMRDREE